MVSVLITTSGTGSRLGEITKYTNKSLVPMGNKLAICHIIEAYDIDTEFIITIGYKGELVKEFCSLAYPSRKITYVSIDNFEGPGSSLLYSMIKASSYLQKPFIFHCCDTILSSKIPVLTENTVFVCKDNDYNSYSTICGQNGKAKSIHPKGFADNDFSYIGIAYYNDYSAFWTYAKQLYNEDPNNQSLSDIHCIHNMMMNNYTFNYNEVPVFYDTGNVKKYQESLKHFNSDFDILAKNNESLCFLEDKVIKFQADKTINEKRYKRGLSLQPHVPRILDKTDHFIMMEFVKGELLAESSTYGHVSRLLEWAQNNLWINKEQSEIFKKDSYDFYITKTKARLSQLKSFEEKNTINSIFTGTVESLLKKINIEELLTDTFVNFHGDFIFDNILKKEDNSFCLLDWRHEFGSQLYHGDLYYDLAKLRHNLIFNHKNITNKLYTIKYKENEVYVDLKCNYLLMKQLEDFDSFLEKYNYNKKKVLILNAIVWLNMAPLYEGSLRDFLFYFGKFNLYLAISAVRP